MTKKILITGASGHIGSELLKILTQRNIAVRALVRSKDDVKLLEKGVEGVVGDLTQPDSLTAALADVEKAFLLPGYPGIARAMAEAGVKFILQSSGGSAALTEAHNAIGRYMAVSEKETKQSGANWAIIRPSAFMSNTEKWVPAIRANKPVHLQFSRIKTALIDPADIAAVAAEILLNDNEHSGHTYRLSGGEALLPEDCIRILEKVLDRKISYKNLTDEETIVELKAEGTPQKYIDAFSGFYIDHLLDESIVYPTVTDILHRPPRTYEQWAEKHLLQV